MGQLKYLTSIRINSYNFLRLHGFMFFSGSIESDNHNGAIEIFDKHSDK